MKLTDEQGNEYDAEEVDAMFSELESADAMNDFLWSLHDQWETKRFLSQRQLEVLVKRHEEIA
jgi:hypothetical protein